MPFSTLFKKEFSKRLYHFASANNDAISFGYKTFFLQDAAYILTDDEISNVLETMTDQMNDNVSAMKALLGEHYSFFAEQMYIRNFAHEYLNKVDDLRFKPSYPFATLITAAEAKDIAANNQSRKAIIAKLSKAIRDTSIEGNFKYTYANSVPSVLVDLKKQLEDNGYSVRSMPSAEDMIEINWE
jgi:hypothetical protein